MDTSTISRRGLLKGGGALVVSFSFSGPASRPLAQSGEISRPFAAENPELGTFVPEPGDYLDPRDLNSWLAIMEDGLSLIHI